MKKIEGHKFPHKLKGDWKQCGNGKSTESVRSNMKGRWTIKWENQEGVTLDNINEFEEIEQGDEFNVSIKSKGDLDHLSERHMSYLKFYSHLNESNTKNIVRLNSSDVLSFKNGHLFVNNRPFEATDPDESQDWIKGVENNTLVTRFKGRDSMINYWKPEEISGYYIDDYIKGVSEGDVSALKHPAKINYTDNDNYINATDSNKSVPNVTPPLNTDTVINSIPNI
jgi:hypothetical protein